MQTPNRKPFTFGRDADTLNRWLDSVSRTDRDARYAPCRYDRVDTTSGRYERYVSGLRHVA